MTGSLKESTFRNVGLNAVARAVTIFLQLGANVVLARNLTSNDYGIVGFASIFIGFLSFFSDFGLNSAAIQKSDLDERGLHTGFTLKILTGIGACAVALLLAPLTTILFDDAATVDVIRLLSIGFIINSFSFIPTTVVIRNLDYGKLVLSQVGSAVVNFVITVAMAYSGYGYWSIVAASICSTAMSTLLLNLLVPVRTRFFLDRNSIPNYVHFGGNLLLSGLTTFVLMNIDNFVIGVVKGSETLGYYALAFNWGAKLCEVTAAVMLSVLFPTFSKIQDDKERIRNGYLKAIEIISFLSVTGYITLFLLSKDFLYFILGHGTDKWLPALATLRIFCFYGILRMLLEPVGSVIMAIGGPDILLKANLVAALAELSLLYPALKLFGIEGVALIVTLSYSLQYLIFFPAMKRKLGLRYGDFLNSVKPAFISGLILLAAMGLTVDGRVFRFSMFNFWLKSFICVAGFIAVYGISSQWKLYLELRYMIRSLRA